MSDLLTGPEIWFGPAYLVVIATAAWSLGWWQAIAVGLASLALTLSMNGLSLYPYSGAAAASNIVLRVAAISLLIALLHTVRQMYAREWRISRTDPLTGALNRKAFFELTSSRAYSRGWSVLVYVDLDGFKDLNDTYGHAAGDSCLTTFVSHVSGLIRKDDMIARLGGDEFGLYLDVRDEAAAQAVAVRLHRAMNSADLDARGKVKCSVGALIIGPGPRLIDHEVHGADVLMYEAKGLGASLVVARAVHSKGTVSLDRCWELTPEAQVFDENHAVSRAPGQSKARTSSAQPELLDVA